MSPTHAQPAAALRHAVPPLPPVPRRRPARPAVARPARSPRAPRWLSTDLRDGNQALIDPMNAARKNAMFDLLVRMGYKEIEVGFPAASQTDFDFVRSLIEGGRIPDDVRISVLTQAREELIERTVQSLVGAPQATVHMYNAAAPVFRKVVFGFDGRRPRRVPGGRRRRHPGDHEVRRHPPGRHRRSGYEYSPEIFMDTELDFSPRDLRGASWTSGSPTPSARSCSTCPAPSSARRPTSTPTRSSG